MIAHPMTTLFLLALHMITTIALGAGCRPWEEVKGYDLEAGVNDPLFPAKRYGAVMVFDKGSLVINGGYLFDRAKMKAVWLPGDFWLGPVTTGEEKDSSPQPLSWTQFRASGAIGRDARYKAASAVIQPIPEQRILVLFGGGAVDGFTVVGSIVAVNLETGESYLTTTSASAPGPRISAMMVAVSRDAAILYGGLGRGGFLDAAVYYGEFTVTADTLHVEWSVLATRGAVGPAARRASVLCAMGSSQVDAHGTNVSSVILFGGFGKPRTNLNDVWLLEKKNTGAANQWAWRRLHDGSSSSETDVPAPRGGAVGVVYGDRLIVAMGATCGITCITLSDVWVFDLHILHWRPINNAPPPHTSNAISHWPMSRQFAAAAFAPPHWLYVFGGESFEPHAYWNDLWRLRVDVSLWNNCSLDNAAASARTSTSLLLKGEEWNPPVRAPIDRDASAHRGISAARARAVTPGGTRYDPVDVCIAALCSMAIAVTFVRCCLKRRRR